MDIDIVVCSRKLSVILDISVPFAAPRNVLGHNSSSSSIFLSWEPVSPGFTNGNITGYRISYTQARTRVRRAISKELTKNVLVPNQLNYIINDLKKFTDYEFRVAAKNKRGIGLDSDPILIRTDQGSKY